MIRMLQSYSHWDVSLHENQGYLGRCVVWCKRPDALDLPDVENEEREELFAVLQQLKEALSKAFQPDWFNYAFFGNEVRHLHCHVVPRYAADREFVGHVFRDERYGHSYRTDHAFAVPDETMEAIRETMANALKSVG